MSEAKGPLDAAIWYLGSAAGDSETWSEKFITELRTAIRVLKAAGKVDKKLAIQNLRDGFLGKGMDEYDYLSIRAFLESLPDKEEK